MMAKKNLVYRDGQWGITDKHIRPGSPVRNDYCVVHVLCDTGETPYWTDPCSCNGRCAKCNEETPDAILGFLQLMRWDNS
jgi:hypothetical protein